MLPSGYERLLLGHAVAVARSDVLHSVRRALVGADGSRTSLHEYAARHPAARLLRGRGATYAVPLPQCDERVVIRHNRHGGLFGPLSGDRFIAPTRAPYELETSLHLTKLGVSTPQIVAYALYPPGGLFQRADVCSIEVPDGRDLASILARNGSGERAAALDATAKLVAALARVGARHHDLNAKNILIANEAGHVLDVDRVTFGGKPESVLEANLARLNRSLRKWRDRFGTPVSEGEMSDLERNARSALQNL